MKLIITRHGETYDNLEHLLTGQKDVELTEKGQQEAEELSKKLNNIDINIIYCSALKRTKDTISPYLKDKTIEINYTEDLKEMDLGKYNGATAEEVKEERSKGLDHRVGGGESLYDLYNRADSFLRKIIRKHVNDTVLIVGSNAINRNIIGLIKGYSIERINEEKERYPNVSILEFEVIR